MNDNVNRRIHHVARILQSPTWCGLHSEQIKSVQTIYSRIGMQGGQTSRMTGVHGLNKGECFNSAYFSDNQSIGSQTKCRSQKII
jgi:hypothetical protein